MWRELSIYAYTFNEHIFIDDCRAQIYGDAIRVFLIFMMFIFRLLLIVCWGYDKDFKGLPEYHTRVVLRNTHPIILFLKMLEKGQMKFKCVFLKNITVTRGSQCLFAHNVTRRRAYASLKGY